MTTQNTKEKLRTNLKKMRTQLGERRKQEASEALLCTLSNKLALYQNVLSFASFNHEIDTTLLNLYLASTNRLLLPKVGSKGLEVYKVQDPESQTEMSTLGTLEPNPKLCQKIDFEEICAVIVPGLAFDRKRHRLGYGKGHYDRLLASMPKRIPTFGVGFKEQFFNKLPTLKTDVSLTKLYLF